MCLVQWLIALRYIGGFVLSVILMDSIKVVVVTRFGIGMKDKAWYDYRYIVHKALGQACMLNQTNQNFDWVICLDESPPEDFLEKLKNDFKDSKNIHLLHIKSDWIKEYRDFINENVLTKETKKLVFARRDDDDAVNVNFVQNIYDYLRDNEVELCFVPEKHSIDDDELTARVRPLQPTFHWGKLIQTFFKDKPDVMKYLFYGRSGTDIRVYYKSSFVGTVGRIAKHGKVEEQLQGLAGLIDGVKDSKCIPYAHINLCCDGFILNAKGRNQFWPYNGTLAFCYSILPVQDAKMTSFEDSQYEIALGHNIFHQCGAGVVYNRLTTPEQYVYARTQVNDCRRGTSRHSVHWTGEPESLNDRLKDAFSITDEGWQLYLDTTTEYRAPLGFVDPTLASLKKAVPTQGQSETATTEGCTDTT